MNSTIPELPAVFGSFYLYDLIGKGGMAEIFLAKTTTSLGTERQCVIKRILPYLSCDKKFGDMLIDEAKLCARLSHGNVVHTLDLGVIDDLYYIAMEYVEGFDLNRLLGMLSKGGKPLALRYVLYVVCEMLRGLDYAHRLEDHDGRPLGIIHRDVSPTNVLISIDGGIKLCDFGIAKAAMANLASSSVDDELLGGKMAYMSPEQVAGEAVDLRSDLFAVGIVLWEMLSGRRLYKTKDEDETYRRALKAEIPPLVDCGFPEYEKLAAIVAKALQKDPQQRYQGGGEFIQALDDYIFDAGLFISQLQFADFVGENFGDDLRSQRQEREAHLAAALTKSQPQSTPPSPSRDLQAEQRAEAILASFMPEPPAEVGDEPVTVEETGVRSIVPPGHPSMLPVRLGAPQAGRKWPWRWLRFWR